MNENIYASDNEEISECKYTWNDYVFIVQNAPNLFHPGQIGVICGMSKMKFEEIAKKYHAKVGDWIYTVEFGDGTDVQVPECFLDKDLGILQGTELSQYYDCFIGGLAQEIKINLNTIEIKLKSQKVNKPLSGNVKISPDGYISGKLIIVQIQELSIRNSCSSLAWQEKATILELEAIDHLLNLLIEWDSNKTTSLYIKAGQIWWEQR